MHDVHNGVLSMPVASHVRACWNPAVSSLAQSQGNVGTFPLEPISLTPPLLPLTRPADAGRVLLLLQRLAALYTGTTGGGRPGTAPLNTDVSHLRYAGMAKAAAGSLPPGWQPAPLSSQLSPAQWRSLPGRLVEAGTLKQGVHVIHLPAEGLARLKALAQAPGPDRPRVSTLDAVQGLLVVLTNSLRGLPLVPAQPALMTLNAELLHANLALPPGARESLARCVSNIVGIIQVPGVHAGQQPHDPSPASPWVPALQANAGLIRARLETLRCDSVRRRGTARR